MGEPLRKELNRIALLAADGDTKKATILAQWLGWDGLGGATWDELGNRHALPSGHLSHTTQLCLERLRLRRVASPILDEVITAVNLTIPAPAEAITDQLVDLGLIDDRFDFRGIGTAGEVLGKPPSWTVVRCGKIRLLTERDQSRTAILVTRALNKRMRAAGVVRLDDLLADFRGTTARPITRRDLQDLVNAQPGVEQLEKMPGWFWRRAPETNPVVRDIAKMLSVATAIDLSTLRQGLLRGRQDSALCPTEDVLAALCSASFKTRSKRRRIMLARPLDPRRFLDQRERRLVKILQAGSNVLTRKEIQIAWLETRRDLGRLDRLLHRSPFIEQLGRGVYSLRGSQVQPGQVERICSGRTSVKQIIDYGWQDDGQLWLKCRVTPTLLASGRVTVPAGLRRFLLGNLTLLDAGGTELASIVCSDSGALPLQGYLRWARSPLQSTLLLVVDPTTGKLSVSQDRATKA